MKRILSVLVALVALLGTASLVGACSSSDSGSEAEVVRMWIGPELADCVGVGPMTCMQVSYSEDGETQLFYDSIEGFEYVEGTSYVIDVEVTDVENPPADASSKKYTLVEVISETPA
jgi:hypothetical protein